MEKFFLKSQGDTLGISDSCANEKKKVSSSVTLAEL